jgi:hypothetical protein
MEVVAWLAVTKYRCRLEGGFVRDWIVRSERVSLHRNNCFFLSGHFPGHFGDFLSK